MIHSHLFYALILNVLCLGEKQQIQDFSVWFDPTGARTHDLQVPYLSREPNYYIIDGIRTTV
jgi:hypothetical protein